MFEDFEVKKGIFERLPHGLTHFELCLDGRTYEGQYRNGDVNWFHPQPDPDNHEISIDVVEAEVCKIMVDYIQ